MCCVYSIDILYVSVSKLEIYIKIFQKIVTYPIKFNREDNKTQILTIKFVIL